MNTNTAAHMLCWINMSHKDLSAALNVSEFEVNFNI